jgi:WD40 repeat protein
MLWDLAQNELISEIRCPAASKDTTPLAALNPLSGQSDIPLQVMIACGKDLFLWDIDTENLSLWKQFEQEITQLAFSPLGDNIIVINNSKELRWIDSETGNTLNQIALEGDANYVEFTPDSKIAALAMAIATEEEDETDHIAYAIVLLDLETGETIQTLLGHDLVIRSIDISSDGQYLISGSNDNTAIYWDIASGQIIKRFELDTRIFRVAFKPDESMILTVTEDGIPQLWQLKSLTLDEVIAWTEANRQVRELNPGECARLQLGELCISHETQDHEEGEEHD